MQSVWYNGNVNQRFANQKFGGICMNTIKYFILVMKAPRHVYGGLGGKFKHFNKMLKYRKAVRQNGGKGLW